MAKSRGFSIYLLKESFNAQNALKNDHNLELINKDDADLPTGALMYIADRPASIPWWKNYWGLNKNLNQVQKGAIVFLPVESRWVVLTFGMTYHQLNENSYEYDFGLRTSLNALDPEKIKSTDILEPESAKRERIQSPTASNLTFFDIRQDESIVKKLTGAVREEYKDILTNITGSSSLRITSKLESSELIGLCKRILEIYNSNDYAIYFPDIQNIVPIKDPDQLSELNQLLLDAFESGPVDLVLSIPEIIDHTNTFTIKYTGAGRSSLEFNDIYIGDYRHYLEDCEVESINNIIDLKNHKLKIIDENNETIKTFSIYKCLLYECEINNNHYNFCEGEWYQIDNDYFNRIIETLDTYFIDNHNLLIECEETKEDAYNLAVANSNPEIFCLDKSNISPAGQTQIEPCDLLANNNDMVELIHVKISTRSSSLSHLFNQGYNSVTILRMMEESRIKLKALIANDPELSRLIDEDKFSILYGIITKKPPLKKSRNLPLFSRISLFRVINNLKLMKIPCYLFFIKDNVTRR
jgi:uncharacterized protein (TIGR04141 family)